ncbi:hypothetical protein O181_068328 [Austropuccinia psidii MF-1]|uniref:CHY-type domain-containing protein n=1 Tax=Austropuccinia psidii MF-1 TaxID=1389203 RepID=A0A9Q3F084_9BASI|nr:hypothetical protein [Austropuccinia psidii MF-1]
MSSLVGVPVSLSFPSPDRSRLVWSGLVWPPGGVVACLKPYHRHFSDAYGFMLHDTTPSMSGVARPLLRASNTKMCKHILNAQVSVRAPCCRKWFDCADCHNEQQPDHQLFKTSEIVMMCKKCKRAFRKQMDEFDDSDEYCPHCDNHYVLEAKVPQAMVGVEGEDSRIDGRGLANRDERTVKLDRQVELAKLWEEEFASKIDA